MAIFQYLLLLHLFEQHTKICLHFPARGYKRLLDSNMFCHRIHSKKLSEKQTSDILCISCLSQVLFPTFFLGWKWTQLYKIELHRIAEVMVHRSVQQPLGFQLWHVPRVHIPLSSPKCINWCNRFSSKHWHMWILPAHETIQISSPSHKEYVYIYVYIYTYICI